MGECTHNCETCGESCSSRQKPEIAKERLNPFSSVKKVIGVVSGKGGVGKSLVTSMAASGLAKMGYATGILDADVTGPSIPRMFGVHEQIYMTDLGIVPAKSEGGVHMVSVNLMLENETDPVVWRGPVIAGCVKQFWTDVIWHDIDVMMVDMPPGTGDVPLTVFQSLPVDGILIVTSPQELVEMIVGKAVEMAKMMNVPILGLVENMSYLQCPDCGSKIRLFGESKAEAAAARYGIDTWTCLPLDPSIAALCDAGEVEKVDTALMQNILDKLAVGL